MTKKKNRGQLNRVKTYQSIFNVLKQFLCYHCIVTDFLSMLKCKSGQKMDFYIPPNLQVRLSCLWCSIRRQFLFKKVDIQWAASSPQSRAETLNILMKGNEIFTIFFIIPLFNIILIQQSVGFYMYLSPQTLVWHKMASRLTVLFSDGECSCKTRVNIPKKTY